MSFYDNLLERDDIQRGWQLQWYLKNVYHQLKIAKRDFHVHGLNLHNNFSLVLKIFKVFFWVLRAFVNNNFLQVILSAYHY
jgi:hypothetical protein